ncbi:MAG: hypothetical protein PVJ39_20260 [Gammaproteobacteria bacterium]|jgi:hypothetical protein
MGNSHRKLELVWDINKFRCQINGIDIAVAPSHLAPFKFDAIVEEQDTALILGETDEIRDPGEKPAWYLANKLESQTLLTPGQIIIRDTVPLRLQAIVHDLDAEPSCNELWVYQALEQIFEISESRNIPNIQMPLLGTHFSRMQTGQFLDVLLQLVTRQRPAPVEKIWLVTTEQGYEPVFQALSQKIHHYPS